jgi:hypothetical protein
MNISIVLSQTYRMFFEKTPADGGLFESPFAGLLRLLRIGSTENFTFLAKGYIRTLSKGCVPMLSMTTSLSNHQTATRVILPRLHLLQRPALFRLMVAVMPHQTRTMRIVNRHLLTLRPTYLFLVNQNGATTLRPVAKKTTGSKPLPR